MAADELHSRHVSRAKPPQEDENSPAQREFSFRRKIILSIRSEDIYKKRQEAHYTQLVGGFNPFWKILVKMGIFPK